MPVSFPILICLPVVALIAGGCAVPRPPGSEMTGQTRTFGPFYERTETADGVSATAVRPFYSRVMSPREPHRQTEYLWPLASSRDGRKQRNWRVLFWIGTDYDRDDPESKSRVWLFPLWFHGRNSEGEAYRALFPIHGEIHNIAGVDRFQFTLFPLYSRRRTMDIEQTSIFWPVYARTTSDRGIEGHRVFPFYGTIGREADYNRRFILWPLWNQVDFAEDSNDPGRAWMLFPLLGYINTEQQQGGYLLPPLFCHIQRADGYRRLHAPWPLVQIQDGDIERRVFWPLWGSRRTPSRHLRFVAWPLLWRETVVYDGSRLERQRVIPVWSHDRRIRMDSGEEESCYRQLWPLFVARKDGDRRLFRLPTLWPGLQPGVERNWSPLWTIYQRREISRHVAVDAAWGIWRFRRAPDGSHAARLWPLAEWSRGQETSEWSLLGGLVGFGREPGGGKIRLAYLWNIPLERANRAGSANPPENN